MVTMLEYLDALARHDFSHAKSLTLSLEPAHARSLSSFTRTFRTQLQNCQQVARQLERAEHYYQILTTVNDVDENDGTLYLRKILEIIGTIPGYQENVWVGRYDGTSLQTIGYLGKFGHLLHEFYSGSDWYPKSIGYTAIKTRDFAFSNHYSSDPRTEHSNAFALQVHSAYSFPILQGIQVWGLFTIASPRKGILSPGLIEIVKRISRLINRKFANIDLKQREQQAQHSLSQLNSYYRTLANVNELMISVHDRSELLQQACERISSGLPDIRLVWVGWWRDGELTSAGAHAADPKTLDKFRTLLHDFPFARDSIPFGETQVLECFETEQLIVVNDYPHSRYLINTPYINFLDSIGATAVICLPLRQGGRCIGVLTLYASAGTFGDANISLLNTLASNISLRLHQLALEDEERNTRKTIEHMAYHDKLTGLPNRAFFARVAEGVLARCNRHHLPLALLELDLDGFKGINDHFGHDAGDALLVEVAQRLKATLRQEDLVFRMGGDEFVILLENYGSENDLQTLAQRIIYEIKLPVHTQEQAFQVGVSIGIATKNGAALQLDDMYKSSDQALYAAKRAGKSCYRLQQVV